MVRSQLFHIVKYCEAYSAKHYELKFFSLTRIDNPVRRHKALRDRKSLAVMTGLEPATFGSTTRYAHQLHYITIYQYHKVLPLYLNQDGQSCAQAQSTAR